jgi:hypothetical protein
MLKTISAALLAVSVIAAPALAETSGKTTQAPVNKTAQAPVIKADQAKSKLMNANANANMGDKHYRHHRHHEHMGTLKTHAAPKIARQHATPAAKRG